MHNRNKYWSTTCDERGQTTLALVAVMALAAALAVAIALVGQAMVHRARARTAADAIALATTAGPDAERSITQWYESQGVVVERRGTGVWAGSGPSQASAWAGTTTDPVQTAPVLRAIVARVEQLRGQRLATVTWGRSFFEVSGNDVQIMRSMSAEFLVCETATNPAPAPSTATRVRFERC